MLLISQYKPTPAGTVKVKKPVKSGIIIFMEFIAEFWLFAGEFLFFACIIIEDRYVVAIARMGIIHSHDGCK